MCNCNQLDKTILSELELVMQKQGWVSDQAIRDVAKKLGKSEAEVFGVATFYSRFKFNRAAKHQICICTGTACFVLGANEIMQALEKKLNIKCGQTTADNMFSLDEARCFGCCSAAPVVRIDGKLYEKMTAAKIVKIVEEIAREDKN